MKLLQDKGQHCASRNRSVSGQFQNHAERTKMHCIEASRIPSDVGSTLSLDDTYTRRRFSLRHYGLAQHHRNSDTMTLMTFFKSTWHNESQSSTYQDSKEIFCSWGADGGSEDHLFDRSVWVCRRPSKIDAFFSEAQLVVCIVQRCIRRYQDRLVDVYIQNTSTPPPFL